jgi:hypothetical protein
VPDDARLVSRNWRDAWMILCVTVLLLPVMELAYRAQSTLRERWSGRAATPPSDGLAGGPLNPYADSAWAPAFFAERPSLTGRWEPFVYYRGAAQRGRFFTIDSSGLRVTPQSHRPGSPRLRVFFFGGSTTWGYANRDSTTRPALVARRLAQLGYDPEVVNFAQQGWVSMQGLITLVQELRAGNIPDVVVFWDGENEVPSAWRNGRAGVAYRDFEHEDDSRFGAEMRRRGGTVDTRLAIRSLLMRSALLRRAFRFVDRRPAPGRVPDPKAFCQAVVGDWLREASFLDQLAARYGFVNLMIWQPQWYTSNRPKTRFERELVAPQAQDVDEGRQGPHRQECARQVDALVAAHESPAIVNLSSLLATDTGTVFFDIYGHTPERITALEADTLVALMTPRLAAGRAGAARKAGGQPFRLDRTAIRPATAADTRR